MGKISNLLHIMKKALLFLLTTFLCTSLFAWQWNKEGNLVTISANSKSSFVSYYSTAPWFDDEIKELHIVINEGITSIEPSCFQGSKNIVSVTIPDSCTIIKEDAFRDCPNLFNVSIPTNTKLVIKDRAFYDCPNLTPVITGSKTVLGKDVFKLSQPKIGTVQSVIKG